jgi:hypothetical protein
MNRFRKELIESLTEAREHAEGGPSSVRVHVVEAPDERAIRHQIEVSQRVGRKSAAHSATRRRRR